MTRKADDAAVLQRFTALVKFEEDLAAAAAEFSAARDGTGRIGVIAALKATHTLIVSCEIPLELYGPLLALAFALDGLDSGSVQPMVAPVETPIKPKSTEGEWVQRAWAAAILQLRYQEMAAQKVQAPLEIAAAWVNEKLLGWPLMRTADDGAVAIKYWRAEMGKRPSSDSAVQVYTAYVAPKGKWTSESLLKREPYVWGIQGKKSKIPPP